WPLESSRRRADGRRARKSICLHDQLARGVRVFVRAAESAAAVFVAVSGVAGIASNVAWCSRPAAAPATPGTVDAAFEFMSAAPAPPMTTVAATRSAVFLSMPVALPTFAAAWPKALPHFPNRE